MAYSGKFTPKNKDKYKGNWQNIKWRSSWEYTMLKHLDANPNVIAYSYEEVIVPYRSQADGGKIRRYYLDFYVKYNNGLECLIEVKPYHETQKPSTPKLLTERNKAKFNKQIYTYVVNKCKWDAAEKFCKKKGWKFFILTEQNAHKLGLKFGGVKRRKKKK